MKTLKEKLQDKLENEGLSVEEIEKIPFDLIKKQIIKTVFSKSLDNYIHNEGRCPNCNSRTSRNWTEEMPWNEVRRLYTCDNIKCGKYWIETLTVTKLEISDTKKRQL